MSSHHCGSENFSVCVDLPKASTSELADEGKPSKKGERRHTGANGSREARSMKAVELESALVGSMT